MAAPWDRRRGCRTLIRMSQRTCVMSRPVGPADRQALLGLFARSSADTRRDRFHHALSLFPQLYLDEIVTGRQPAMAARDVCHHDRSAQVVGLASAAPTGPGTAEFAVWVEDAWQDRGADSLLAPGNPAAAR
jgi:hypothetical protein